MTPRSTITNATPGAKGKAASAHPGVITKGVKAAFGVKAARGAAKHPGVITKIAKAALDVTGVEAAARHPRVVRVALKAGKPVARRKVRKRIGQVERFGNNTREVGEALLVCSALVAQGLGLVDRPKPRPAAPLLAGGVVIGASAVYLFQRVRGQKRGSDLPNLAA